MVSPEQFTAHDPNFTLLLIALILLCGVVAPLVYAAGALWTIWRKR